MTDASQFYTGLVADLYEPLAGELARADDYVTFLERAGTPALELACGSGLPLVELRQRGYEVEGLDSSRDMLDRCRERAARAGVDVVLHEGEMQRFSLGRRFRSIFLAGASFTLLTTDADASAALDCMLAHLEPGGAVLVPLERPDLDAERAAVGVFRETRDAGGAVLRVGMVALETEDGGRTARRRLRYERVPEGGAAEVVERDWLRRAWSSAEFRGLLEAAGFADVAFVAPSGGPAPDDARLFVALARRPAAEEGA